MRSPLIHLLLASLFCSLAFTSYGFWYATVAKKSAAVAALQNQINAKTETASRIATTRTALSEIAEDEAIVRDYFVPETGVVAFINSLEGRGRALGTDISVLSVSNDTKGSARPVLAFALSIKGTFDAVMRTVGSIEYAPYDIEVTTLSVGQDAENSWHANVKLLVGSVSASAAANTP